MKESVDNKKLKQLTITPNIHILYFCQLFVLFSLPQRYSGGKSDQFEDVTPLLSGRHTGKKRITERQDWLHNLSGPEQTENVGPLLKKSLRISSWYQQSSNPSTGPCRA